MPCDFYIARLVSVLTEQPTKWNLMVENCCGKTNNLKVFMQMSLPWPIKMSHMQALTRVKRRDLQDMLDNHKTKVR